MAVEPIKWILYLSSFWPIFIFIGITRLPDSFFSSIITINGIFFAFSVLLLSKTKPAEKIEKEKIKSDLEGISIFNSNGSIKVGDSAQSKNVMDEQMRKYLMDFSSEFIASYISTLISNGRWFYIMAPFLASITIAMGRLLHEGTASILLAIIATWFMLFSIVNAIWIILKQMMLSSLSETLSNFKQSITPDS